MDKARIRLNVNIDAVWGKRLQAIGNRDDRTVSDLVREAVRLYLQHDERRNLGPIADYGPMSQNDNSSESDKVRAYE